MGMQNRVRQLTYSAFMVALCYIGFYFFRFDIPTPGGKTAVHLGNAFCLLSSLIFGGVTGGISGAVGMSFADLLSGTYAVYAPQTFILKFIFGLVCGYIANNIGKINDPNLPKNKVIKLAIVSTVSGMIVNVILSPLTSFFYAKAILGVDKDPAKIYSLISLYTSSINAVISVIISVFAYMALRDYVIKNVLVNKR